MGSGFSQPPGNPGDLGPIAASDDLLSGVDLESLRQQTESTIDSVLIKAMKEAEHDTGSLFGFSTFIAFLIHLATDEAGSLEKKALSAGGPILQAIVEGLTDVLLPLAGTAGTLSSTFVAMLAGAIGKGKGVKGEADGASAGIAGQYAYDNIVAPMAGITGATDPTTTGAGEANIQRTLGSIVEIHLVTWVINLLSNLTGVGALKFMNSFSEVMTSALNVRGMSRLCMRPYMDTMITKPATHELNTKFPLNFTSESSIVKAYLRGAYTATEFRAKMRAEGYDDTWATQALLDASKELTLSNVVYLVRSGSWDQAYATQYLVNTGWDPHTAPVALSQELFSLVLDLNKRQADALGTHFAKGELSEGDYMAVLQKLGFTEFEQIAYRNLYALENEFTKPLTYTQVTNLYKDSLVDLNFVRDWMLKNGNSPDDADLLILLDFTEADQRQARKAALGAAARVASVRAAEEASVKKAQGDAALAAAYAELADKKAALAASLGQ
jgi:hypothetical protein